MKIEKFETEMDSNMSRANSNEVYKCFDLIKKPKMESENKKMDFVKVRRDFTEMLKSKYVEKWVSSYKGNQNGKLAKLDDFCIFLNKTPDELIIEHYEDELKIPIEREEIAKRQFDKYFEQLKETGVDHNSARQYVYSVIKGFYKKNLVPVVCDTPAEEEQQVNKVWEYADNTTIKKDDQKQVLKNIRDALSIRNKAILLCKLGSGLDDVELFNLKIQSFKRGYIEDYNTTHIKGRRKKSKIPFNTFFNSEGTDMLNVYIKDRERKGEEISNDSYLFVARKKDGSFSKPRANSFSEDLKKACETLGYQNITPKRLRDWFRTQLRRTGITEEVIKRMMGHKCDVSAVYDQMFNEREEFAKFYAVDKDIDAITSLGNGNKKITHLETEMNTLKETIVKLSSKNVEFEKSLKLMKEMFNAFMDISDREKIQKYLENLKNKDK